MRGLRKKGRPPIERTKHKGAIQEIIQYVKSHPLVTIPQLARKLHVSYKTLANWIYDEKEPTPEAWELFRRLRGDQILTVSREVPISMVRLCKKTGCHNDYLKTSPARKYCDEHLTTRG